MLVGSWVKLGNILSYKNIEETPFVYLKPEALSEFCTLEAALSVTFNLLILELMFLCFKNTVKKLKFRYTFYQFR